MCIRILTFYFILGGTGGGLLENVMEAYNFIVNNYSAGDELFFFGFSRGAYTVRSAAGLVATIGVIKPHYMQDFIKIYRKYTELESSERQQLRDKLNESKPGESQQERDLSFAVYDDWVAFTSLDENQGMFIQRKVDIKVIGVWDTVGALGIPDMGHWRKLVFSGSKERHQFHDVNLNQRELTTMTLPFKNGHVLGAMVHTLLVPVH